MNPGRRAYIFQAVLAYIVLALAWILFSDQLLTVGVDSASLVWLSTAKGVFFVLVSAGCFAVALNAVPCTNAPTASVEQDWLGRSFESLGRSPWFLYLFATALTIAMVIFRLQMQVAPGRPFLILFMLPIILASLFGGLGPGLTATILAGILSLYFHISPTKTFAVADIHDLFQWGILLLNGLIVSLVSEGAHRFRRREHMRLQQVEIANKALRQSEERFRLLFNDAPVAMGLTDQDGRIVALNRSFERLFGYTLIDTPTMTAWFPLAYPDPLYRAQVRQQWKSVLAESQGVSEAFPTGSYRVSCKDGSVRLVRGYSIRLPNGLLTALLDETKQHQAEERLRLWAASFEQAQLGLLLTDARTNTIIDANPAFARQRGYQREEMIGMPVFQLFPPGRMADVYAIISTMGRAPHGLFETEHVTKGGQCFPVMVDVTVVANQDGEPLHRIAYVLDITERKRAEQALSEALQQQKQGRIAALNQMQDATLARENAEQALRALRASEERLALFIEHAPASLAMFDRKMRYLAVSRRWINDYALGQGTILGRSLYDSLPEIGEELKSIHCRGLAGEVVRSEEDRFVRADGSVHWLRWEVRPWWNAAGAVAGIVIFSEDITASKQAKEAIRQLNAELEQRVLERTAELTAANRELDSFAYAVSHDLRAPLRAMNGFSQALLEDYGATLQDEAKVFLNQITLGSRKMGELIDGLLTLSRSTRGELHRDRIDLSAMALRILAALAREGPERRVRCEVEPDIIVRGDEPMLEVVMHNLLANAWKYTNRRDEATIRMYAVATKDGCTVCIADNGAGFDSAHADKVFQPFQRLHRQEEFPGIGIGLATVQRIIHRHGGTITAQGVKDQGATFCFTLP